MGSAAIRSLAVHRTFSARRPCLLTVDVYSDGTGSVSDESRSTRTVVMWSYTCGVTVTLTATPDPGSTTFTLVGNASTANTAMHFCNATLDVLPSFSKYLFPEEGGKRGYLPTPVEPRPYFRKSFVTNSKGRFGCVLVASMQLSLRILRCSGDAAARKLVE